MKTQRDTSNGDGVLNWHQLVPAIREGAFVACASYRVPRSHADEFVDEAVYRIYSAITSGRAQVENIYGLGYRTCSHIIIDDARHNSTAARIRASHSAEIARSTSYKGEQNDSAVWLIVQAIDEVRALSREQRLLINGIVTGSYKTMTEAGREMLGMDRAQVFRMVTKIRAILLIDTGFRSAYGDLIEGIK